MNLSPGFWYLPIQQFSPNNPSTAEAGTSEASSKLPGTSGTTWWESQAAARTPTARGALVCRQPNFSPSRWHTLKYKPSSQALHCADLCSRDFSTWLAEYLHRDVWLDLYQSAFNSLTPSFGRWVPDVRDSLTSFLIQSCLTIFLSQVPITEKKKTKQSRRETRTTFLCRDGLEPDLNGEEEIRNGCAAAAWFHTVNTSFQCLQILLKDNVFTMCKSDSQKGFATIDLLRYLPFPQLKGAQCEFWLVFIGALFLWNYILINFRDFHSCPSILAKEKYGAMCICALHVHIHEQTQKKMRGKYHFWLGITILKRKFIHMLCFCFIIRGDMLLKW